MGLGLAFKAFFRALRDRAFTEQVDRLLREQAREALPATERVEETPERSDALILLAVLQREARLIDFMKEDLSGYSDAQIGAAVRDVQRECAVALERMFALRPIHDQTEGSQIEIPAGFDPVQVKLTGNVTGQPPFRGTLAHQGWQATRCDLPAWTGQDEATRVIAPAEVEVQ